MSDYSRILRVCASYVLAFSVLITSTPVPVYAAGSAPTLLSPAPGGTFPGSSATLSWTNESAASYEVAIGSSGPAIPDPNPSYGWREGLISPSVIVTNLPTDGRTMYIRLFSRFADGSSKAADFTVKAASPTAAPAPTPTPLPTVGTNQSARLLSPTPGSVLTGPSATLTWSNEGAPSYQVTIGSTPGTSTYALAKDTVGTSATINNLPTNGTLLYVRITAQFPSGAMSADYTLRAVAAPTPAPAPSPTPLPTPTPGPVLPTPSTYEPRGVGGGGAMAGFAVNPWNTNIRFVGTDMGTLFRSTDSGKSWRPVSDDQTHFYAILEDAVAPGFNPDTTIVFHAPGGRSPVRSTDGGITFKAISMPLNGAEKIRYWLSSSVNGSVVYAGTTEGLLRSADKGITWSRVSGVSGFSKGGFIDPATGTMYHATNNAIYQSPGSGNSFSVSYTPGSGIRSFSGGRDGIGLTLTFIDSAGSPMGSSSGYVWVNKGSGWVKTSQIGGDFIGMAENDGRTIYAAGSRGWANAYGTKVWVSKDAGATWALKFHQYNWDVNPYQPWPTSKMEWSGVGIDVGWWDSGYYTFQVNQRHSNIAGGSGNFFLFSTDNTGDFWQAPFSDSATGVNTTAPGALWKTQGLEVTSIRNIVFHPKNANIAVANSMDIHGYVSEDHGVSWRIINPSIGLSGTKTNPYFNAIYDVAFDENNDNVIYVAAGAEHDWPFDGHEGMRNSTQGAVFKSTDRGRTWKMLTSGSFNVQYLSIAYDSKNKILYAGRQGMGVARSLDDGATWQNVNAGFGNSTGSNLIIPQIEIDPSNQDVYVLLTGDFPNFSNRASTGIYYFDYDPANRNKIPAWQLLRGNIVTPGDDWADDGISAARTLGATGKDYPWWYPVTFAMDWSDASRKTIYLGDKEVNGAYMWSGLWKTTDRGTTWKRLKQWQNVVGITVDPTNPGRIYVAADDYDGGSSAGKKWGLWYSNDAGASFKLTPGLPLRHNVFSTTVDPTNANTLWITFFGGGVMVGPRPQ